MNKNLLLSLAAASVFTTACNFNESVKIDLTSGLTSKGSGLSCDNVFLEIDGARANRNEFIFGEVVNIGFNNIEGFNMKNKAVFPGMELLVVNQKGDTMIYNPDLYADITDPITVSPLLLNASITIGSPFRSSGSYKASIHIWDKKGKGTFDTQLDFTTAPNPSIKLNATGGAACNEVYLFDPSKDQAITSGKIPANEELYLIFEAVKGFETEDGMCQVGLSMHATDRSGRVLVDEEDLMADEPVDPAKLNEQFVSTFRFPRNNSNPIQLEVVLWDKLGTGKVTAKIELNQE